MTIVIFVTSSLYMQVRYGADELALWEFLQNNLLGAEREYPSCKLYEWVYHLTFAQSDQFITNIHTDRPITSTALVESSLFFSSSSDITPYWPTSQVRSSPLLIHHVAHPSIVHCRWLDHVESMSPLGILCYVVTSPGCPFSSIR